MWQFMLGSDETFDDLERRARGACVRFADQEMPPGTVPARATIGFEVDARSGRVRLLVERGLAYDGTSSEIERWIAEGSRAFDDVAQLRSWLGSTLRDAYQPISPETIAEIGPTDNTLYEAEHGLDEIGSKGLRLAMHLRCRMKDLPS